MKQLKNSGLVLIAALTTLSTSAFAALPASVGTTITGISADIQDMFDAVFPAVALGVGLTIAVKLFKRFSNKI